MMGPRMRAAREANEAALEGYTDEDRAQVASVFEELAGGLQEMAALVRKGDDEGAGNVLEKHLPAIENIYLQAALAEAENATLVAQDRAQAEASN